MYVSARVVILIPMARNRFYPRRVTFNPLFSSNHAGYGLPIVTSQPIAVADIFSDSIEMSRLAFHLKKFTGYINADVAAVDCIKKSKIFFRLVLNIHYAGVEPGVAKRIEAIFHEYASGIIEVYNSIAVYT